MLVALVACVVIANLAAPAAGYCCSPDQWQGDMLIVMGTVANKTVSLIEGTMRMYYDGVNKIVTTDQSLVVDGKPIKQRMVSDYKNDVGYLLQEDGCVRTNIGPWIPSCVPANASMTPYRYGLGDNSVNVQGYYINFVTYEVYVAVTTDTCVPVAEDITGNFSGVEVMQTLTFANINASIADRSVFQIPAQCIAGPKITIPEVGRRSIYI